MTWPAPRPPLEQIRETAQALLTQGKVDETSAPVVRTDARAGATKHRSRQGRRIFPESQALSRFLEDGRLDPDNNLCEAQLRDIALGRKNFLFAGSHDAARRAAGLYSLLRTCAQYGVPPQPYVTEILTKLAAGWSMSRLDDLLPHRWRLPVSATTPAQPTDDRHATTE